MPTFLIFSILLKIMLWWLFLKNPTAWHKYCCKIIYKLHSHLIWTYVTCLAPSTACHDKITNFHHKENFGKFVSILSKILIDWILLNIQRQYSDMFRKRTYKTYCEKIYCSSTKDYLPLEWEDKKFLPCKSTHCVLLSCKVLLKSIGRFRRRYPYRYMERKANSYIQQCLGV